MHIQVVPLGAGQDVGRSCVLVTIGGKNIMFDCGMHCGYHDHKRFPDFSYISKTGNFTEAIDCVIVSHFHLDHCGALPYFTEIRGYDGPIYMTYPTKAICPILLEDYRKVMVEKKGVTKFFTSADIKNCIRKVTAVNLRQRVKVDEDMEICAYYAGHVLGAGMFHVRVGNESVVYTGDYNMTPDRHLGPATIEKLRPDLLITESTYATTIRDSKRARERDFLHTVHEVVRNGGKVLIPVFALGRAQELCILIDTYWERMGLDTPIYFSAGLTQKANMYYKLFISWTNERIKNTFSERNLFEFRHIKPFDRALIDKPGPCVLFATPGMLHAGMSLEVFRHWGSGDKNMVIMPGYCVAGTVGHKLLSGATSVEIDKRTVVEVRCQVRYLSFSAHADAKGIMELIEKAAPANVCLVHGEKKKMTFLRDEIIKEFKVPVFYPANGERIQVRTSRTLPVTVSRSLMDEYGAFAVRDVKTADGTVTQVRSATMPVDGILMLEDGKKLRLESMDQMTDTLNVQEHRVSFEERCALATPPESAEAAHEFLAGLRDTLAALTPGSVTLETRRRGAKRDASGAPVAQEAEGEETVLRAETLVVSVEGGDAVVEWQYRDEELAKRALSLLAMRHARTATA